MGYSLKKKVTLGKKSHTWKYGSHFGKRLTIAKKKGTLGKNMTGHREPSTVSTAEKW